MAEIIDINVSEVVENVQITTTENITTVNINENTGSGAVWGAISGNLSNQTDLQNALDSKANLSDLGAVAFSNDYNDLANKPNIPTLTSQLTNNSGFITIDDVPSPDLSGLVPYTGATKDVDLGNNNLNAKGVKINGTAGSGHLGLKHQSANATAGGQETTLFAGPDGELYYKNDGNTLAQIASRAWVVAQNYVTNVITALGYTPENVANKATNLSSPDNTKYPTTLAVSNENKKATITVELISQLTTNFYAPNALRINSTSLISGSGTLTLKVNDVAYTLGNLIPQGAKITADTSSSSVYNLISIYE